MAASAPQTRNEALDALGIALSAAEQHLFDLNLGVEAAIPLPTGRTGWDDDRAAAQQLHWGRFNGEWCLYVEQGVDADPETWSISKLLNASADVRRRAAHLLPKLLETLRISRTKDVAEINEATRIALAFARGEHDRG